MPGWGQIQWGASSCSAFQDDGGQVFRRSFISSRVVGAACVYREHVLSLQRLVADNVGLKYLEERREIGRSICRRSCYTEWKGV